MLTSHLQIGQIIPSIINAQLKIGNEQRTGQEKAKSEFKKEKTSIKENLQEGKDMRKTGYNFKHVKTV